MPEPQDPETRDLGGPAPMGSGASTEGFAAPSRLTAQEITFRQM